MMQAQTYEQNTFCSAIAIDTITRKHTLGKISVIHKQHPEKICGIAKRIGFTGMQESDLAMYRLKIFRENSRLLYTIPALFVVVNGMFVEYENWKQALPAKESPGKTEA